MEKKKMKLCTNCKYIRSALTPCIYCEDNNEWKPQMSEKTKKSRLNYQRKHYKGKLLDCLHFIRESSPLHFRIIQGEVHGEDRRRIMEALDK